LHAFCTFLYAGCAGAGWREHARGEGSDGALRDAGFVERKWTSDGVVEDGEGDQRVERYDHRAC